MADRTPAPNAASTSASGSSASSTSSPSTSNRTSTSSTTATTATTQPAQPGHGSSTHAGPSSVTAGSGAGGGGNVDGKREIPWAFIDCPTDTLIVLIAHMLDLLCQHNDQVVLTPDALTRFHSRAPPAISIIDYLRRIVKYTNLERVPLLSLLAYIDLTCQNLPSFTLSTLTVHRFLIAGVTAGSKAQCDVFCTNSHYAKVGGIKVNELNSLEREFLRVTEWTMNCHADLLQRYYASLIRSHGGFVQSPQPETSPFLPFPRSASKVNLSGPSSQSPIALDPSSTVEESGMEGEESEEPVSGGSGETGFGRENEVEAEEDGEGEEREVQADQEAREGEAEGDEQMPDAARTSSADPDTSYHTARGSSAPGSGMDVDATTGATGSPMRTRGRRRRPSGMDVDVDQVEEKREVPGRQGGGSSAQGEGESEGAGDGEGEGDGEVEGDGEGDGEGYYDHDHPRRPPSSGWSSRSSSVPSSSRSRSRPTSALVSRVLGPEVGVDPGSGAGMFVGSGGEEGVVPGSGGSGVGSLGSRSQPVLGYSVPVASSGPASVSALAPTIGHGSHAGHSGHGGHGGHGGQGTDEHGGGRLLKSLGGMFKRKLHGHSHPDGQGATGTALDTGGVGGAQSVSVTPRVRTRDERSVESLRHADRGGKGRAGGAGVGVGDEEWGSGR